MNSFRRLALVAGSVACLAAIGSGCVEEVQISERQFVKLSPPSVQLESMPPVIRGDAIYVVHFGAAETSALRVTEIHIRYAEDGVNFRDVDVLPAGSTVYTWAAPAVDVMGAVLQVAFRDNRSAFHRVESKPFGIRSRFPIFSQTLLAQVVTTFDNEVVYGGECEVGLPVKVDYWSMQPDSSKSAVAICENGRWTFKAKVPVTGKYDYLFSQTSAVGQATRVAVVLERARAIEPVPSPSPSPSPSSSPSPAPSQTPSPSPSPSSSPSPNPGQFCYNQSFTDIYTFTTQPRPVDLLFVMDNSGSMADDLARVFAGVDGFISQLPAGTRYRIAVLPAQASNMPYTGKLWRADTRPFVQDSATMTIAQIKDNLNYNLTHFTNGGGPENEMGLYSVNRLLEPSNLALAKSQGFFNDGAALGIIFISDENDVCYLGDSTELAVKNRDCSGITAESVLAKLRALQGDRPLTIAGVIGINPAVSSEYGYGYIDIINLAQGVAVDIRSTNIPGGLAQIGATTTQQIRDSAKMTFAEQPVDPASLQVKLYGTVIQAYVFNETTQQLTVTDMNLTGTRLDVHYCVK